MGAAEAFGGSGQNRLGNARRVLMNIVVPYAHNGPAFAPQPIVATEIASSFRVLPAIDFDHQPRLATGKINNVRPDGKLPRKFGAIA